MAAAWQRRCGGGSVVAALNGTAVAAWQWREAVALAVAATARRWQLGSLAAWQLGGGAVAARWRHSEQRWRQFAAALGWQLLCLWLHKYLILDAIYCFCSLIKMEQLETIMFT